MNTFAIILFSILYNTKQLIGMGTTVSGLETYMMPVPLPTALWSGSLTTSMFSGTSGYCCRRRSSATRAIV